jgi:glycosyltransferase involved in cell wall biosynthesis
MNSISEIESYNRLETVLSGFQPRDWGDITAFLKQAKAGGMSPFLARREDCLELFSRGTAFLTFSYGIDGVSIETAKYARALEGVFAPFGNPSIHFIGGTFKPQISSILDEGWHRHQIDGMDGWDKWDNGKWFNALFYKRMRSFSEQSDFLAVEIFRQAVSIAKRLGSYFLDNHIALVVPVNVASNPGNMALTLGLVLVTELLGLHVLNSNHDFYWESGKPASEREPGEEPGVRDHFFRNRRNRPFFSLYQLLYPWNGSRWLQVNINALQSRRLVKRFGFPERKVAEISTCITDTFFQEFDRKDVVHARLRMAYILSDGEAVMHPVPVAAHLARIGDWMRSQKPVILGSRPGLTVDPQSDDLIVMLQPTRIVGRKRIERNLDLITSLLRKSDLKAEFIKNPDRQLVLHITGPVPKEHQSDLEKVLKAYRRTLRKLSGALADRVFLGFSVGHETHPSFLENRFQPLTIEDIYLMADVVVFPSETEGRGLPIIEASACGIPIICTHYKPREVFDDVIGRKLPEDMRIRYTLYPEGRFRDGFLSEVANFLLHPAARRETGHHNREVVRARYSQAAFKNKFEKLLLQLGE